MTCTIEAVLTSWRTLHMNEGSGVPPFWLAGLGPVSMGNAPGVVLAVGSMLYVLTAGGASWVDGAADLR